ncbi:MAG: GNAT family N-acetyltransferase [Candidatus Saganbacteria bacterium]|nr:GNAT family N-acetyltransferase [Candidatus Saganbacteria bacterium]
MREHANISLNEFTGDHINQAYEWVKNPGFKHLFLLRGEITFEGNQRYFEKVMSDPCQKVYAIYYNGKHIGNCGIKDISLKNKEAEIWIYIGDPSLRGKGVGSQATKKLLIEAAKKFGIEKTYLHVAEYNTAAIKMYKNLGFKEVPLRKMEGEWSGRGCEIIYMELKNIL